MKALVVLVLVVSVARGDDRAAAERYFRAGAKAYAAQRFAAAAAHFEEAYRALALPEIAFSTAQAYRKLYRVEGKPAHVRRAIELYRVYLDKVKQGGRVGDAVDNLGEMERALAQLGPAQINAPPPAAEQTRLGVHVSIAGQVADRVREVRDNADETSPDFVTELDGKVIEPFALVDVTEGDHVVRVHAPGYYPVEKQHRAVKGATALVEVELAPVPAKVSVATEPGARILVDGRGVPAPTFELVAGKHVVTVLRAGREPFARELTVARGEVVRLDAPLAKTGKRRAVPWVVGGASVLAGLAITSGVLAVVLDGRASDHYDRIERGNATPAIADAFARERDRRDDARTACWLFGGAALAAGTAGFLLYTFDTPGEAVRVAPLATGTSAGVTASGRF